MSRIIDVICENQNYEEAIQSAKRLVEDHLVVVSYVIPAKVFTNDDGRITEKETTMLILKSKDIIFRGKLLPKLCDLSCQSSMVLPIVDVASDYRAWVETEVTE